MSDSWNQQPPDNQPPDKNSSPNSKSDGLLSSYKNMSASGLHNLSDNNIYTNQSNAGLPSQPPAQPGQPGIGYPPASQQPPQQPKSPWQLRLPQSPAGQHGLWSNAKDTVREWSGKMAAVMGSNRPLSSQSQQPPQSQPPQSPRTFAPAPGMVRHGAGVPPGFTDMRGLNSATPMPPHRSRATRIAWQKRQRRNQRSGASRAIAITTGVLLAILLITSFAGSAYGYSYYQQQLPQMEKYANQQISQNTRIYDRNGVLLYEAYDQSTGNQKGRRVAVQYADIPQVMQDAMIAIEDKTFWTNQGVDLNAIVRAASSSNGGASTLTQQLIKNLSGNTDPTYQRKLAEAAMAIGLTQNYPKTKIMEMYFNVAPFGANTYGVEVAAEDLFGLKPDCKVGAVCVPGISKLEYNTQTKKNDPILGLARASLLASIPNNPTLYDPTLGSTQKANALQRQKLVLQDMITQGLSVDNTLITPAMAQQAEKLSAKMTFKPYQGIKRAPNFVDYVVQQVETALGHGDYQAGVYAFLTGGYNIRTTIDVNLVDYTQRAIQRHLFQPEAQKPNGNIETLNTDHNVNDAAVVVIDNKTGEVLGMNGGADYNSNNPKVGGEFNAATGTRPPGSTFKLFDYATAFQMGWNPGIVLHDTATYFPNGAAAGTPVTPVPVYSPDLPLSDYAAQSVNNAKAANDAVGIYTPTDYGDGYWSKDFTIRFALENSFNISAIRAMQYAGEQTVIDTARRLGVTGLKSSGLALAIGSTAVSPLQLTDAYATFGNSGNHVPPQTILDIWDNNGNVLYHYNENKPPAVRVFSPQVSYVMTSVLMDEPSRNFEFAGDHDLSLTDIDPSCASVPACGHQVAAKTGTTDSFADNWTLGYTADVSVGVWVGNADNSVMNNIIGITGAAPIWHSVMENVLGICNYATDQVPCNAQSYHFRFSGHPQWQFPVPSGLTQSMPAGLGGNAAQVDWMLQH